MSRGNGTHPLTCPLRVTHSPECVLSLWFSTNQYLRIILPALYGFGHGDHSLDRPSEINWSPREISFRTSSLIAWTGMVEFKNRWAILPGWFEVGTPENAQ